MSLQITKIRELIYQGGLFSTQELELFESLLSTKTFKKGDILTYPGDSSDTFFLINKGILRNFLIGVDGKYHTKIFHGDGGILGSYVEFISGEKAKYHIEAVTDCVVDNFSMKQFEDLMGETKSWLKLRLHLAEASFLDKEQREIMMLSGDVLHKYRYFQERFHPFSENIPKHMIASYIGSTPEGLSKALRNI